MIIVRVRVRVSGVRDRREPVCPGHTSGGGVVCGVYAEISKPAVVLLTNVNDGVPKFMSAWYSVFAPWHDLGIYSAYRRTNGPLARDGVITLRL